MHHRLVLAGLAATGGLLTTAFLQVAVAAADPLTSVAPRRGRLHHRQLHLRPHQREPASRASTPSLNPRGAPPLLELGGGTALGILEIAPQNFEVFDPTSGTDLGSIEHNETVTAFSA